MLPGSLPDGSRTRDLTITSPTCYRYTVIKNDKNAVLIGSENKA